MNEVINFNYEGNEIPFRIDENGEVFIGYSGSFCATDFGVVCPTDFGSNCATG